jgi:hypothetical protein
LPAWQADWVIEGAAEDGGTPTQGPSARLCLAIIGISALALVVLGALFVPWSWVPG